MTTARRFVCPDVRRALLATLALLALGAGSVPGHAGASNGPAESSDADTITTALYPGWNLVGWLGPTTPTSELFDAIPALRQVWAWEAEEQAYTHARRDGYRDLAELTPGMGVWLRVDGASTFEWTRPADSDGVAVRLHEEDNLVAVAADGAVSFPGGVRGRLRPDVRGVLRAVRGVPREAERPMTRPPRSLRRAFLALPAAPDPGSPRRTTAPAAPGGVVGFG